MGEASMSREVLEDLRSKLTRNQFAEVLQAVEEYRAAEAQFRASQAACRRSIRKLATKCLQGIEHGSDRNVVGRHLYWHVGEVSVRTIADVWRVPLSTVAVVVGAFEQQMACTKCGARVAQICTSRVQRLNHQNGAGRFLCDGCMREHSARLQREYYPGAG